MIHSQIRRPAQGPPLVCVSKPVFLTGDQDIEPQIIIHVSEHELQRFHFTSTFKGYGASPDFICKGEYVFSLQLLHG